MSALIAALLLMVSFLAVAQESIEDLERKLADSGTNERAPLLNLLAVAYLDESLAQAYEHAESAKKIGLEQNDNREVAKALKTMGIIAFHSGDNQEAIRLTNESLEVGETTDLRRMVLDNLHNLSIFHRQLAEYDEALATLNRALETIDPANETVFLARTESEIGTIHYLLGDLENALTHCLEAARIQEHLGDEGGVANTLNTIAVIQDELGNSDLALDYYQQSMATFERLDDIAGKVNPLNNIGVIHYVRGELDLAEAAHLEVLEIRRQLKDRAGVAVSLNNLGNVAVARQDLDGALARYHEALAIKEELGDPAGLAVTLRDIGDVERERGNLDEALRYTERSLELARSIEARVSIKVALADLATIYQEMGRFEAALKAYREFHDTEKSILSEQASEHLAEMQTQYETERKEKEIEALLQQTRINRQRQQLLVGAVALAILLMLLVWNRYRLKARANRLLNAKQETISEQNRRLEELNEVLTKRSEKYYTSSIVDQLTGTYNKAYILEVTTKSFSLTARHRQPLACVFLDVDHFKKVNDTWGHLVGDRVLSRVAATILSHVRSEDTLGRYGGEEFLLILPNTDIEGARKVAEKIIRELPKVDFEEDGLPHPTTISAGLAEALEHRAKSAEELIHMADTALYQAKAQGRNRACSFVNEVPISEADNEAENEAENE